MKIPPVGTSFSVLNVLCEGREKFFGSGVNEGAVWEVVSRCGSGQRVISVLCVTGWNVAKDIMAVDLLGPACRIMSGLGEVTGGGELSCWIVA